ncbi:MAG: DUF1161 domain-containing protein [Candidatus Electrothrix sp. AU1_5]|nr:DUF1161 domain-containing protein [Candidatus Electrothrix gigas]MCI5191383.1 DUF1161 domain-containing protein [Candidatus Electrothrix gigas]MCI5191595.1 DUF1161 domain-containing protein [Candidatus Electrothrix gigas]
MKLVILFILILSNFSQAYAAIKPCEELKAEIAVKLDAKGVKSYELIVVTNKKKELDTAEVRGEIVGSCDGGLKKIIYTKKGSSASTH